MVKHICDELESVLSEEGTQPQTPSLPGVVLLKHSKNRDVRAVSHVCRGWRSHATAFACLWRDIAFDIADPKSIRLAKSFLSLVENKDVLLRVYVGFSPENTSPNRSVVKLFGDLRRHIHRWEVFEYQGSLGEFRSYLDLPAPNLRYFSDHRDPSHPRSQDIGRLFTGWTPSLHYLLTSSIANWNPKTLSCLTEFHFERTGLGPPLSLDSLLKLLQGTPVLEELRLGWLGSFTHDCAMDTSIYLPHLRTLLAHNTDFYALTEHIYIPDIREVTFTVDTPTHPSFQAPHALAWLPPIPILNQPILELMVVVARTAEEGNFRIHLTVSGGGSFDIRLIWEANTMQHWKTYISEALSALVERIRLDPQAILRLYLGVSPARQPSSEGALKIHGGFARRFLQAIIDHKTTRKISTPLARRLVISSDMSILDEDETQMFRLCLRSRTACETELVIRLRHGDSPWLCAADFECPVKCKHVLQTSLWPFTERYRRPRITSIPRVRVSPAR